MKKHLSFLMLAAALLVPWVAGAQSRTVTVGNWSATTSSSLGSFHCTSKYSWTQTIYPRTDMGAAGWIQSIVFDNRSTAALTCDSVKIYLGRTSMTEQPSSSTVATWLPMDSLTLVFSATNYTIPGTPGELVVDLSQPYYYDGTGSLAMVISKANSGTTSSNTKMAYTSTTRSMKYSGGTTESYCRYPTVAGTNSTYKTNVKFYMTAGADDVFCTSPANLRVTSIDDGQATLAWNAVSGDSYYVGYAEFNGQTAPSQDDASFLSIVDSTYTFTNLSPATKYRFFVLHECMNDEVAEAFVDATTTAEPLPLPLAIDFEDEDDDAAWAFANSTNGWYIDTLDGNRKLFVSNTNGTTNAYATSSANNSSWAWIEVDFEARGYNVEFDWRCVGESGYDYMRVMAIPASTQLTTGWGLFGQTTSTASRNEVPAGWVNLASKTPDSLFLNLRPSVQHYAGEFSIPTAGVYHLAFFWSNDGSGGSQPPAMVDNLSIAAASCFAPMAFDTSDVSANEATINITHPSATSFIVTFKESTSSTEDTIFVNGTSHTFTGLRMGTTYEGRIYTDCDGDTSVGYLPYSFTTGCRTLTLADLPYREDFEAYTSGSANPISPCWDKGVFGTTTQYPYPYNTAASNGSLGLYFYSYRYSATNQYCSWAALPQVDEAVDMNSLMMEFYMKRSTSTTSTSTKYTNMICVGIAESIDFPSAAAIDTMVTWIDTFDISNEAASSVHRMEASFAGYTGTGRYVVFYEPVPTNVGGYTYYYNQGYVDDVTLMVIPSCYKPTEVVMTGRTHDEMSLSWVPDERTTDPLNWVVEYGPEGFTPGEGTIETTTDTLITIEDLSASTVYDFYVSANCGDVTSDGRLLTVRTHCAPVDSLPYTETFESYPSGTANPISPCWTKNHIGGTTNYPYPYSSNAITGDRSLYFYSFTPASTTTASSPYFCYAALPAFDLSVSQLGLSFNMKRYTGTTATYFSQLLVGVMTDADDISTFDTVQVFDLSGEEPGYVANIYVDFSQYDGDGLYMALVAPCPPESTSARYNVFYIDDIVVDAIPGCPRAQGIDITDIVSDGMTLNISDSNEVDDYIVTIVNLDDTTAETIVESLTDTTYTFDGLTPNTRYRLTMVSDCGDGTYTIPYEQTFRTACAAIASEDLPYIEDFETYTTGSANPISPCWTKGVMGGTVQYPYPYSTAAIHGSMGLYFYATNSLNCYAALPLFEEPLDNLQVSFSVKHSSTATYKMRFYLGVMSDPHDLTTFDTLQYIDLSNEPASSVHRLTFSLFGYSGEGNMAILLPRTETSTTYNAVYLDSLVVDLLPSCVWPDMVVVDEVGTDYVSLTWTGNGDSYEVQASLSADFDSIVATATSTVAAADVTGLDDYTQYYFRVRGVCGEEYSAWSSTVGVRTALDCGPDGINIIDSIGTGTSAVSTCAFYPSISYPRAYGTAIYTAEEMLLLGVQNNTRINGIKMHVGSTGGRLNKVKVYMAETTLEAFGTTPANDTIDRTTMTLVYSGDIVATSGGYVEMPFDVPFNYNGGNLAVTFARDSSASAAVTFRYTTTSPEYRSVYGYYSSSTATSFNCYRSNSRANLFFNICTEPASCERPSDVAFRDLVDTSVTITWTGSAAAYEYLLDTASTHPDSLDNPTLVTVNTDSIFVDGLDDNTTYYFYVRAVCDNEHSEWSLQQSFTTKCAPLALPYTENFESYASGSASGIDPCWTKKVLGTTTQYPYPYSTNAVTGNRSLYFYSYHGSASQYSCYAALPMFQDSVKNLSLTFNVRRHATTSNYYTTRLVIGVMSNPDDISTFEPLDTLDLKEAAGSSIHGYEYWFNDYTGDGRYIAIYDEIPPLYGTATYSYSIAYVDDIAVDYIPSCPRVTVSVDTTTTTSTATVRWTASAASGATYEVEYGPAGHALGTGVTLTTTDDSIALTGLETGSTYEVYVRVHCSSTDVSEWSFAYTFRTECGPKTVPAVYDPEDYATGSANIPYCWTRITNIASPTYPYINTSAANAHSGTKVIYYYFSTTTTSTTEAMVLPEVDVTSVSMDSLEVSFWAKSSSNNRPFVVGVMSNPNDLTTFQGIDTIRLTTTVTEYTVSTFSYTGSGSYIALLGYRDTSAGTYIYVDDVRINRASACPRSYALNVVGVTANSAVLRWTDTIGSTQWLLRYRAADATDWTELTVSANPYTLTGLTPRTVYTFQVAPVCQSGSVGDWSNDALAFSTSQVPATLPYSYDFENGTEWQNWQTSSNNHINWFRGTAAHGNATTSAYISADSGATHSWDLNTVTNAVFYRDFDFGTTPGSYTLTYNGFEGGSTDGYYDGISIMVVDPSVPVESSGAGLTSPWGRISTVYVHMDTTWGEYSYSIDNISGVKRIAFIHYNQATAANHPYVDYPTGLDNISIVPQACVRPVNPTVVSATPNSVTLTWTGDSVANYLVEYIEDGGSTYHYLPATTNQITISNLPGNTGYSWWVRKICTLTATDTLVSAWSPTGTFATLCGIYSAIDTLRENFESYTGTAYNAVGPLPGCWQSWHTGSNDYTPHVTNGDTYSYCISGTNAITLSGNGSSTGTPTYGEAYLRLYDIAEPTNTLTLAYWFCTESNSIGALSVGYLTGSNYETDFVALKTINASTATVHASGVNGPQTNAGIFDTVSFDSVPAGHFPIAFKWISTSNTLYSASIDDIAVWSNAPTCSHPEDVEATAVTHNSATLTWTGDAESYEVALMQGEWTDPTTGTAVANTTISYSDLLPGTLYFFGVRAICDEDIMSDWEAISFYTEELPCYVPTNLAVGNIGYTSVQATFTPGEGQTEWQLHLMGQGVDRYDSISATTVTVDGLVHGNSYQLAVRALCGDDMSAWSDTVAFSTVSCDAVQNVTVSDVTGTTARVSWTATGAATYIVAYGYQGSSQNEGTQITVSTNSVVLTGLDNETAYDVYVRSVCADGIMSVWSSVANFTTTAGSGPEPTYYTITVLSSNSAWGTVSGGGSFLENTTTTISATPNQGYLFVSWQDGNTDNPRTITVTADMTYTATFADNVGIDEVAMGEVTLFPNPASSTVTVRANGMEQVSIIDLNGRTVMTQRVDTETATFDLGTLAKGTYFVRIVGQQASAVRKLVVK